LAVLDLFEAAIALASKAYYQSTRERDNFQARFDQLEEQRLPLTMGLLPMLRMAVTRRACRQVYLAQMLLGIELEMHRRSTGSYPDSLAELKPTYFKELPVDPFSGQPFHYRKEGKGYLLYSVGENGKDEEGLKDVWEEDHRADDIAWSVGIPSKAGLDTSR
jgi:hypothetical protein